MTMTLKEIVEKFSVLAPRKIKMKDGTIICGLPTSFSSHNCDLSYVIHTDTKSVQIRVNDIEWVQ